MLTRPFGPPCNPPRATTPARPSHPIPNVRDDRDTPLTRAGTARGVVVIWVERKPKYFWKWGWTGKSVDRDSPRKRTRYGAPNEFVAQGPVVRAGSTATLRPVLADYATDGFVGGG